VGKRGRKRERVRKEDLSPALAAGFTESPEEEEQQLVDLGYEKDEESGEWRDTRPDGLERNRMMSEKPYVPGTRIPLPRFIGHESDSDIIVEFADGRKFHDITKSFDPETVDAIVHGMICLRCLEPQPFPDADEHLPGCEGVALVGNNYMKERQRIDFMAEFEGEKHYGPGRPIQAFLEDQAERKQKRDFIVSCVENGREVPRELLNDKDLFPDGPPKELIH
jgi:hypothetical protein